jgi:uncharacterized phage infection (PIP) family protein YhgE
VVRRPAVASSIASQTLIQAMSTVNTKVGQSVSAQVAQQTGGAPLAGAVSLVLAHPIDVQTNVHHPLPNGTGNGLWAFHYAPPTCSCLLALRL